MDYRSIAKESQETSELDLELPGFVKKEEESQGHPKA
jgi:hypothetical protein